MTIDFKPILKWVTKNSPEILSWLGVGGVVITSVLVADASIEVYKNVQEHKYEDDHKTADTVRETAKNWVPAVASAGLTIASIICSNHLHRKREAALMALAAMWQGRYYDFEKRVKELPKGEKVLSDIRDKEMAEHLPDGKPQLRPGEILVYEPMSKQFFVSSNQEITAAELIANKIMQREEALTLNEFLRLFRNARQSLFGSDIGWFKTSDQWKYSWDLYGQGWIDILPYTAEVKGRSCVYLDYGVKMSTENPLNPPTVNGASAQFGR